MSRGLGKVEWAVLEALAAHIVHVRISRFCIGLKARGSRLYHLHLSDDEARRFADFVAAGGKLGA